MRNDSAKDCIELTDCASPESCWLPGTVGFSPPAPKQPVQELALPSRPGRATGKTVCLCCRNDSEIYKSYKMKAGAVLRKTTATCMGAVWAERGGGGWGAAGCLVRLSLLW